MKKSKPTKQEKEALKAIPELLKLVGWLAGVIITLLFLNELVSLILK